LALSGAHHILHVSSIRVKSLNSRLFEPQSCLDAFEKRNIPLLKECVFFGSHMMDGLCCSSALKEIKILFQIRNENITFGGQYQFMFSG